MSSAQYDDICAKLAEHQKAITQQGRVLERTERMLAQQEGQLEQILSLLSDLPNQATNPQNGDGHRGGGKAGKAKPSASNTEQTSVHLAGTALGTPYTPLSQTPVGGGSPEAGPIRDVGVKQFAVPEVQGMEDFASSKHQSGETVMPKGVEKEATPPGAQNPFLGFFQNFAPPQ